MEKLLILRSQEVVDNFIFEGETHISGYARAFGAAWTLLTDEAKLSLIKHSERRKAEQEQN
jgi:Fe-S cluster biosynthesis and repair protein YggX